ncbi:MAG: hypothetical protein C5B56_15445 [Proteobacteria bacterium]|nr:MAG: hypothetical protein C5B56_15445 [Pseudomonadota bacterium]
MKGADQAAPEVRNSIFIPRNEALSRDEMEAVSKVADQHGFYVTDRGDGIILGDTLGRPADDIAALQGDLTDKIRSALMDPQPSRVEVHSVPAQWDKVLKGAQIGDRKATSHLLKRIEEDPTLLHDPELNRVLMNAARHRLARDLEYERLTGDKVNPAKMNANRLLAQGGLPPLVKEFDLEGFLPMLFLGLGIPALGQAGCGND